MFWTRLTKIHEFVSFVIRQVPVKLFFKKNFWNFEKFKNIFFFILIPKGPLEKNQKYSKEWFFFKETYFFILNLNSTGS